LTLSEYLENVPPGECRGNFQCQDVQELTYPDNSFDVCTCTEVFEHVANDVKGFSEIYRVLKEGGYEAGDAMRYTDLPGPFAPSVEEMGWAIVNGINAILGFKDDQGEPMNEDGREFLVMVGTPALWSALNGALGSSVVVDAGAAVTNVLSTLEGFKIRGEFNPRLAALTTQMLIFRTDSDVKPFIRQEEEPIKMSAIAEGSELEFNEDVHHYGIKALRNVGYGYWQMASYSTFS